MPPPREDLVENLREHLGFLDSSCNAYDLGAHSESKRLATSLRILLHDTSRSTSILRHLEVKDTLQFINGQTPEVEMPPAGATLIGGATPGVATVGIHEDGRAAYFPMCAAGGLETGRTESFETWWTSRAMIDASRTVYSRRQFVLWMANNDGGVHVDTLPETYRTLTRENSMGWTHGGVPAGSPVPAAIRQIAEEVRHTIRTQISQDDLGYAAEQLPSPEIEKPMMFTGTTEMFTYDDAPELAIPNEHSRSAQPRNAPCACGSGKKYKKCCGAPPAASTTAR